MMRSKFCIFRIDSSKINWPIAATTQFYLIFIPKLAGMRTLPGRGFRSIWNGCIDTMNNLQILACVLKCSMILLRSRILAFARKNSQGLLLFDYHPIQQVPKKMSVKNFSGHQAQRAEAGSSPPPRRGWCQRPLAGSPWRSPTREPSDLACSWGTFAAQISASYAAASITLPELLPSRAIKYV
jgi:hypothetical protein